MSSTKKVSAIVEYSKIVAERDALKAENKRLLDINNSTYCAYCNASYERTDDALAQVRDHIRVCEFHPMRTLEVKIDRLRAALVQIADYQTSWEFNENGPMWTQIACKALEETK